MLKRKEIICKLVNSFRKGNIRVMSIAGKRGRGTEGLFKEIKTENSQSLERN